MNAFNHKLLIEREVMIANGGSEPVHFAVGGEGETQRRQIARNRLAARQKQHDGAHRRSERNGLEGREEKHGQDRDVKEIAENQPLRSTQARHFAIVADFQ